jgi:hypothetical protein
MNERFVLQRLTPVEWIVLDTSRDQNDPHRTIACVYEEGAAGYEVIWLRDLGLPSTSESPQRVLDDVRRVDGHHGRIPSRKPVPIPHRPPGQLVSTR